MYMPKDMCRRHDYGEAMAKNRNVCKRRIFFLFFFLEGYLTTPSLSRQKNMVMGPSEPETKNNCAGEGQQQIARP
jgi:hypothetical protein